MYKERRTVAGRGADVVCRRVARADAPGAQDIPRAQAVKRAGGGVARVPLQALPLLSLPARGQQMGVDRWVSQGSVGCVCGNRGGQCGVPVDDALHAAHQAHAHHTPAARARRGAATGRGEVVLVGQAGAAPRAVCMM